MQYKDYLTFYGLDSAVHKFYSRDFLPFRGLNVCCHYFIPERYKELIILMHGYLDHTGNLRRLINYLLSEGYAVAAFDLPGHGLSEGVRTYIADFYDYGRCTAAFIENVNTKFRPGKMSVVAHSTGCSALIAYFQTGGLNPFREIILAAPLIRQVHWRAAVLGLAVVSLFNAGGFVKRKQRQNSSDRDYLSFRANDPLQPKQISLIWLRALIDWNKRVLKQAPFEIKVHILQGDEDITVEWKYNLPVVERLFPRYDTRIFSHANHQLFNETPMILNKVLTSVSDILTEQYLFRVN